MTAQQDTLAQAAERYEAAFAGFDEKAAGLGEVWSAKAEQLRLWAGRWVLDGYCSMDADVLASMVTDDFEVEDPALFGQTCRGPQAYRRFVEDTFRAFPDNEFDGEPPYLGLDGNSVVIPWRATGTFNGPLAWSLNGDRREFAPTGRRYDLSGLDVYMFRGDKVCRLRSVYDAMQVCQQLGILPGPRGWAMRVAPWALAVPAALMRRGLA